MTKNILSLIFFVYIIFLCTSTHSVADEISFRCTVHNEYHLSDEGQLVKPEKSYYTNASFSVDRTSGKITGGVFKNNGDYQVRVIDNGSFKVFSFAKKRGVAESVAIKELHESNKAPFVGVDYLQTVVTGICD